VKLVKEGYRTVEFDYTVPNTAATVTKTLVAKKPDFKITSESILTTGDIHPGDTIQLSVTIKNVGDKADTGNLHVKINTDPQSHYEIYSISEIKPNETKTFSPLAFHVPSNAIPNTYPLEFHVAPSSTGKSTDERTLSVTIKAKNPELKITNAYYSLDGGSTWTEISRGGTAHIPAGSKPKFKVCIKNDGGASEIRGVWLKEGYGCSLPAIGAASSDRELDYSDTEDITFDASTGIKRNQNYSFHVKDGHFIPICPSDDEFDFYNVSPAVEITFVTKDEQGNELGGVDVYIDGVKKGTT